MSGIPHPDSSGALPQLTLVLTLPPLCDGGTVLPAGPNVLLSFCPFESC